MAAIISDTSPLNYLILIDAVEFLPRLFSEVIIPPAVANELSRPKTPLQVRQWLAEPPVWLRQVTPAGISLIGDTDGGEREAIILARELSIKDLLIDDGTARRLATAQGLTVFGTLGILETVGQRGWIDFDEYAKRLRATNCRIHEDLIRAAQLRLARK